MSFDAAALAALPLFEPLSPEERQLLAEAVEDRSIAGGETLFKAGESGQSLFVVASGAIELSIIDRAGQRIVLNECRAGDVFGELAMLDAGPRSATAVALEESRLIVMGREQLLLMISKRPEVALHLLGAMGAMTRKAGLLLRTRVVRNVQTEIEDLRSLLERLTDWIAAFSGSMTFLAANLVWFAGWIYLNESGILIFDPYPFGFLTMVVSLEAIILSILVLLAQNRQTAKDHIRDDVEYEINVKAELEVAHLHEKVEEVKEGLLSRLKHIEVLLETRNKN